MTRQHHFGSQAVTGELAVVQRVLELGQEQGILGDFDARVMAVSLKAGSTEAGQKAVERHYGDLAEREAKWNAFVVDPEWLAVRAATEKDGPIVASIANSFLEPTPFSSVN